MRIIVDGYNVIGRIPSLKRYFPGNIGRARDELNELLRGFKKIRGHRITVVYDGPGGMWGRMEVGDAAGIREIFAPAGKRADDVIIKMAREKPEALVVVSADREIADACHKAGAAVMSPEELENTIMQAVLMEDKGPSAIEEDDIVREHKKGPSRRLPKKKRKEIKIKRKL